MIFDEIDIEASAEGDLVLQNGDLKIATVSQSVAQAITFIMLTDYGDYSPRPLTGANLGSFIGKVNSAAHRAKMKSSIMLGLDFQGLVTPGDYKLEIVSLDIDHVMTVFRLVAVFEELDDGDILETPLVFGYIFPWLDGTIVRADISD